MTVHRVLIDSLSDFYRLDFLKEQKPIVAICADPTRADNLSLVLPNDFVKPTTIAQFVKSLIRDEDSNRKIYRKSELFLLLSVVWKRAGGELTFNKFNQAYTLLTDYRGYTSDINLIHEILGEHPDEISTALKWFYAYMDVEQILDEQSAYQLCSEILKEKGESLGNIMLIGFSHFSPMQIELINTMGMKGDVYIPCYRENEENIISTDWPYWLDASGAETISLICEEKKYEAKVKIYPKGYLSMAMQSESKASEQVMLFDKNPDIKSFLEVDQKDSFYKVPANLFMPYLPELESEEWSDSFIDNKISESVLKKDFIRLKIYLSLSETLKKWREISDQNKDPLEFDRKIILEILKLDLPRVFSMPVGENLWSQTIFDLSRIEALEADKKTVVCVKNSGLSFSSSMEVFSEKIKTFLVSLGPIRNVRLERKQLQCQIKELLTNSMNTFLIEDGTLDENIFWSELEIGETEKVALNFECKEEDYLQSFVTRKQLDLPKVSASRFQTYLDCPRKYYFSYLNKWNIDSIKTTSFSSADMGLMVHEVIEVVTKDKSKKIDQVIKETMNKFSASKAIPLIRWEESRYKIRAKAKNGIQFLNELKNIDPNILFNFERPLAGEGISGRIDLFWESEILGKGIVDFKSSSYGIPNNKEHAEFKKIQLWYYLLHCGIDQKEINLWGYFNLSKPESSLFYSRKKGIIDRYKLNVIEELSLTAVEVFLSETKKRILNEQKYLPLPSSPGACTYCHLSNLCPKGVIDAS